MWRLNVKSVVSRLGKVSGHLSSQTPSTSFSGVITTRCMGTEVLNRSGALSCVQRRLYSSMQEVATDTSSAEGINVHRHVQEARNTQYNTARDQERVMGMMNEQKSRLALHIFEMDQFHRRTGRVSIEGLREAIDMLTPGEVLSPQEASFLLRCCGSSLAGATADERTSFLNEVWEALGRTGIQKDVTFYNLLLSMHLENDHSFHPDLILQQMKNDDIQPNRVTYLRLITLHCANKDMDGAGGVLEKMKEENLSVNENVFNVLIYGYIKVGEAEKANELIEVMKQNTDGGTLSQGTYAAMLRGYAELGEWTKMEEIMATMEEEEQPLADSELQRLVIILAKHGHEQYVKEVVAKFRMQKGYFHEAINMSIKLMAVGCLETGYEVLKTVGHTVPNAGGLFVYHLVRLNNPLDVVSKYLQIVKEDGLFTNSFKFGLYNAYKTGYKDIVGFFDLAVEHGLEVHDNYIWPIIIRKRKEGDKQGILETLKKLNGTPSFETWSDWVFFVKEGQAPLTIEEAMDAADEAGWAKWAIYLGYIVRCLRHHDINEIGRVMDKYQDEELALGQHSVGYFASDNALSDMLVKGEGVDILYRLLVKCRNDTRNVNFKNKLCNRIVMEMMFAHRVDAYHLEPFLHQFKDKGLCIDQGVNEQIHKKYGGEVSRDLTLLIDSITEDRSDQSSMPQRTMTPYSQQTSAQLEAHLERRGDSVNNAHILRFLCFACIKENNVEKAEEVAEKLKAMLEAEGDTKQVVSITASLIEVYLKTGQLDKAYSAYQEVIAFSGAVDGFKTLDLTQELIKAGKKEDAMEVLTRKTREVSGESEAEIGRKQGILAMRASNLIYSAIDTLSLDEIRLMMETLVQQGYVRVTSPVCSAPAVWLLKNNRLEEALEEFNSITEKNGRSPPADELFKAYIREGNQQLLEKAFAAREKDAGNHAATGELGLALVWEGKVKAAQKVFNIEGFIPAPARLRNAITSAFTEKNVSFMKNLLNVSLLERPGMENIRDHCYRSIINVYAADGDCAGVLDTYESMEEVSYYPSDEIKRLIANVLEANGKPVPFAKPPPPPPRPFQRAYQPGPNFRESGSGMGEAQQSEQHFFSRRGQQGQSEQFRGQQGEQFRQTRQPGRFSDEDRQPRQSGRSRDGRFELASQELLDEMHKDVDSALKKMSADVNGYSDTLRFYLIHRLFDKQRVKDALEYMKEVIRSRTQTSENQQLAFGFTKRILDTLSRIDIVFDEQDLVQIRNEMPALSDTSSPLGDRFQRIIERAQIGKGRGESILAKWESDHNIRAGYGNVLQMSLTAPDYMERITKVAEMRERYGDYHALSALWTSHIISGRREEARAIAARVPSVQTMYKPRVIGKIAFSNTEPQERSNVLRMLVDTFTNLKMEHRDLAALYTLLIKHELNEHGAEAGLSIANEAKTLGYDQYLGIITVRDLQSKLQLIGKDLPFPLPTKGERGLS